MLTTNKNKMRKFNSHNLYLTGFGRDVNGNSIVKLKFHNQKRGFSIQTNGGSLPLTDVIQYCVPNIFEIGNLNFDCIGIEVSDYIEKFGSKNQKILLRINKI